MSYSNKDDSKDDAREIIEDAPTFTSMAIAPSRSTVLPLRRSDPIKQQQHMMTTVLPLKSASSSKAAWNVPDSSNALPPVPSHRLERTHVSVPATEPLEIAARIADCLQRESIAATFDDEQALVRAETKCCLKFVVRLWQKAQVVVVEVQRTSGCSFLYLQTAKTILRAAKFGLDAATKAPKTAPIRSLPRCVPPIPDSEWEECTAQALEIACDSLKPGNRMDAHRLGLESLVELSSAPNCRALTAKTVLAPGSQLLGTIVLLIQCSKSTKNDNKLTDMELDHVGVMHRLAATILANCLETLRQLGPACTSAALQELTDVTCESTLQALVLDLVDAPHQPHEAAVAAKCLRVLCRWSPACKARVLDMDASRHVASAQHGCRHDVLRQECTQLMRDLCQ